MKKARQGSICPRRDTLSGMQKNHLAFSFIFNQNIDTKNVSLPSRKCRKANQEEQLTKTTGCET